MAGITKIGQHEVTEIKRDAAQVGCTKVTRAEVEELLKKMDSAPRERKFLVERSGERKSEFVNFIIRNPQAGWVSASEQFDFSHNSATYLSQSAGFCLITAQAQELFEFLGGALGHESYSPENQQYKIKFQKV